MGILFDILGINMRQLWSPTSCVPAVLQNKYATALVSDELRFLESGLWSTAGTQVQLWMCWLQLVGCYM